ncbi:ferredoxin [Paracoccus sp. p4-l81]|uniref:ferredoxin n=1 Tax=unclassified Paracoccus (in: a-proteobacteria) TaxID=2688777 RepID=UPI0035BA5934
MRSLWLLAPQGAAFWAAITASPEWSDGRPDPMDRWSRRVIDGLAADLGGVAAYPFGLPHQPFYAWALRSGRAWPSPVRLMVHDRMGLWASFRGAIALPLDAAPGTPRPAPCATCTGQPCRTACPAQALTEAGYDLAACHAHLDQPAGAACLLTGCAVRTSCPLGHGYGRLPEQSAWHMRHFHP